MTEHAIPDSSHGRTFKRTLTFAWYAAIVGAALQINFFFWQAVSLAMGGHDAGVGEYATRALSLAGWSGLGWIAYRSRRYNTKPSAGAVLGVVLLVWAALAAVILTVRS